VRGVVWHVSSFFYAFLQRLRSPAAVPPGLLHCDAIKLKRKRDREIDLEEHEGIVDLTGCCLSFPSDPW
jgi:hypothetical protein